MERSVPQCLQTANAVENGTPTTLAGACSSIAMTHVPLGPAVTSVFQAE